uniref:SH2 domain-containing protein 4B n=1 Tax=Callorhinchus milii TaxID=7868 RepID=V9KG47_CALMI
MLQQILETMYIEPELLAELNEEQKQMLYFKMREEQVRRWKENETKLQQEDAKQPKRTGQKKIGKSVGWLLAADQNVWVWVLGEGPGDKPYEQICDEIIAERARQQAQKEAGELRRVKEKELTRRFSRSLKVGGERGVDAVKQKEAKMRAAAEEEARKVAAEHERMQVELKQKEDEERRTQEEEIKRLEEERTQQLYINLKEAQEMVQKNEKEDPEWRESLRKSKAADERRKSVAKQARDDYKRLSLKAIERGKVAALSQNFQSQTKPAVPPRKPVFDRKDHRARKHTNCHSSQEKVVQWFREQQIPLRAGYERYRDEIAPWFHGIISRQEAEDLLSNYKLGGFLIRVSERVTGYALSYRSSDGFKHFLIDSSKDLYSFFGADQLQHTTLADLVEYHKDEPITSAGAEVLIIPCGQIKDLPDYAGLFY